MKKKSMQKNEHSRVQQSNERWIGGKKKTKYDEEGAVWNDHSRGSNGGKKNKISAARLDLEA
jgi:hypothetical protein